MVRPISCTLLLIISLSSCDRILKSGTSEKNGSLAEEIQINTESKPEIITAFQAISKATYEHNRVFLQYHDANKPANELAYSAGIAHLNRSALEHSGLAKQIINAVAATCLYEKDLFTPFDTIGRQIKGMPTWSKDEALQRRGYIQIIDQTIITYDGAVAYLERGEEPLQRRNFDRMGVPREISTEFLRLKQQTGKQIVESEREMFREARSALQCYRDAMASAAPDRANQHIAQAKQHEKKSNESKARMIAEIRKQMNAGKLL